MGAVFMKSFLYFVSRSMTYTPKIVVALIAAILFFAIIATVSGCAQIPIGATEMSAEQLTAIAKDKNTLAKCYRIPTPYGTISAIVVLVDKGAQPNGTVQIDPDCKTIITNGK